MEYLLVKFSEQRSVVIDNYDSEYKTNQIIEMDGGHHNISLTDPQDYTPKEHIIILQNTGWLNPMEVYFEKE